MGIQTVIRTILRKRFAKVTAAYAAIAILTTIASTVLFTVPKAWAVATVPTKINFQGRLTDSTGAVVADGQYNMKFAFYDASTGGNLKWNETRETTNRVQVTGGLFSVKLGDVTPISDPTIFSSGNLYFEITLANPVTATCSTAGCETWESPMNRNQLATSAYAFNSDTLDGLDSTAFAAASGSANYIQNTSSPQTANFNIAGTGTATTLQTSKLDTASAGTLTLGGTNATGITLANNTTISAGQSLTIAGGATATRPASPTEGMVYYDTTTKQLLTYANGKWQGDGKEAIIVAASNSSDADKASADYVATGTGDQTVINNALNAADPAGSGRKTGKVVLLAGTYTINASISMPNNTTLAGVGNSTIITIPNALNTNSPMITNADQVTGVGITIRNLKLDGNKANQTSGSANAIELHKVSQGTNMAGANIDSVDVENFTGYGINVFDSYNTVVTNNRTVGNNGSGIYVDNFNLGRQLNTSAKITQNISANNKYGIGVYYMSGALVTANQVLNNTSSALDSADGVSDTEYSDNIVTGNGGPGIDLEAGQQNTIKNNIFRDNGGSTDNNGILIDTYDIQDTTTIIGNTISDTSCTATCYAINITSSVAVPNYIADNDISGPSAAYPATIHDTGSGSIYSNQMDGKGNLINQGANAFTVGTSTVNATLSLQGGLSSVQLPAPSAPSITYGGAQGTTSYSYTVTALDGTGETIASTIGTTTEGNITLDSTNYNIVTWNKVSGAVSYNVYRTASAGTPATTGKITASPVAATAGATQALNDTGLAASGTSPATNTTGGATFAGALQGSSKLTLGTSSSTNGSLVLNNSSNANQLTLTPAAQTGNYTLTIPALTANDTICTVGLANCGGSGANTNLSNLASTNINAALNATSNNLTLQTTTSGNINLNAAGVVNLQSSMVLATGKTLTISGDITANRPASPTEGMVYYDTTTKQLLTYANGKWQGDGKEAIIVAASNSSAADQASADYVATGTGDQAIINNALTAADPAGTGRKTGKVVLLAGTYTINASISIPNNTQLAGVGDATLITIPNAVNANFTAMTNTDQTTGTGVTIQSLRLDGNSANQSGSGFGMAGIAFSNMGGGSGSTARQGAKIQQVRASGWYRGGGSTGCQAGVGICLSASSNNTLTGNTVQNDYIGIQLTSASSYNTITGNLIQGNSSYGFYAPDTSSSYNTLAGNTVQGNGIGFLVFSASNTFTGNTVLNSNNYAFSIPGNYNTISANTMQGSLSMGMYIAGNNNVIAGNKIHDSGSAVKNEGVYLTGSSNTITGNDITDTACTSTCYAIDVGSGAKLNYVSSNNIPGPSAAYPALVYDAGTGTIYSNQPDGKGNLLNSGMGAMTVGTSTVNASLSLQGGVVSAQLPTPAAPTITTSGTAGTTSYSYTVTALDGTGETIASTVGNTTTGNATLNTTNYNIVTWNKVSGAVSYNVYRTASAGTPATTGKITASPVAATSGATQALNDTGLTASGTSPTANTTGGATFAGSLQSASKLTLGTSGSMNGALVLNNSTNSNQLSLVSAVQTGNYTLTIPALTANDTICTVGLGNCAAAGSGTTTIGALDGGTANANGATISGTTLYLQSASATVPGLVNTAAQTFAGDKTFNGNITLATGKTLTVAGDITANRPASPTEGMVYYDTTTKQLLTYANGKWQADRSTVTKIIAASNSTQAEKDAADYVASGSGDQTTINSALTAAAGGKVYLMEGTYTVSGNITVPNNTTLAGAGNGTIITLPNGSASTNAITNTTTGGSGTGVVIRDLTLDGNKAQAGAGTYSVGIYLNGISSSTGSLMGAIVTNVQANNWTCAGIVLSAVYNTTVSGNEAAGNPGNNCSYGGGIAVQGGGNTITGNAAWSNTVGIDFQASASNNTVTGNTVRLNSNSGMIIVGTNNTITGNMVQGNTFYGINVSASNSVISANTLYDNGGSTTNNGIYLSSASSNNITGNTVSDSSCSTTCYALNISNSSSNTNYLSNNTFTGDGTHGATINDAGTGTIYAGQSVTQGGLDVRYKQANSSNAFVVQNASGASLLTVDTSAGGITTSGTIQATGGISSSSTIQAASGITSSTTIQATGTITSSASIQGNVSVLTPLLDAASASTTLNIGTSNASSISLNQNTTLAAGKSLTIAGGTTATRPSSPTEGMVYYDTTTKQLLTYANGKWQGDGKEAIIVAANNSSDADKASADYVATGTGDQATINSALTAADPAGTGRKTGRVVLLGGTFSLSAAISVPNNTTLSGVGAATILTVPNAQNGSYNMIQNTDTATGTHVTITNLLIDGNKANQTSGVMNGIYLNGMGAGSGASARDGGKITSVVVKNVYGSSASGITLTASNNNTIIGTTTIATGTGINVTSSSSNNTISGNTAQGSANGIAVGSNGNTITGNTTQGNTYGIYLNANNNTVSGNTTQGNGNGIYGSTASYNTITGNNVVGNSSFGIDLDLNNTNNIVTGNTVQGATTGIQLSTGSNNSMVSNNYVVGNTSYGFYIASNNNTISANTIYDNGGASTNMGIYLYASTNNTITSNTIADTSCSTTCYAINISTSSSTANYLSDNTFTGDGTHAATINDAATNTLYVNQSTTQGGLNMRFRQSNSTAAFSIQNALGTNVLNVDTTNGAVNLGSYNGGTNSLAGKLVIANATNANTVTLQSSATGANYTLTIPAITTNDTICVQSLANCGVNAIGALDGGTANANGATIASNTLYLQSASATNPGLVNTTTQTLTGAKTFNAALTASAGLSASGGAMSLTGNAASGLTTSAGALTLTSAAAATWSTSAGLLTLQGAGGVALTTAAGATSSGVTVSTGNASGGASGGITIDTGTATTTTGTISLGTTNASGITIGSSGITSLLQGGVRLGSLTTNGFVKTSGANGTLGVASSIALGTDVSGTLGIANGGTNNTAFTTNGLNYFDGTKITSLAVGTTGQCLAGNTGAAPGWGACGVNAIGALDGGSANATGATITGTTLYLQSASATNAGLINTGTQTIAGAKTFTGGITIGPASDTTGTLLVLDTKTTSGDPTGANGGMYYNSSSGRFRCYENGAWADCLGYRHLITLTSDTTSTAATTCQTVTGASFPVTAGVTYRFHATIIRTATATTIGAAYGANLSTGSASLFGMTFTNVSSSAAPLAGAQSAINTCTSPTSSSAATTGTIDTIDGVITPSANATFQLQYAPETATAGQVIKTGSTLEWW